MLRDKNLVPLSRQHQHALALCVRIDRAAPIAEPDLAEWHREIAQHFHAEIHVHFAAEEQFAVGDRCVVRWLYTWEENGETRHLRGVDILRVRDGKLAEKLAYVKG